MASTLALVALTVIASLVRSGLITTQNQEATAHLVPVEANAETLVYLQVAWRHGDRTPASPVPFSPASSWDEGLGELTRKGIAQQYRLGKWLRARYGRWLGNRFDRSEVFVRSSDYNRTIMSAQANMAGLFPPTKSEMWDDVLPWQPVPVHTVPRAMDKELYEDISCPTANAEFSTLWRSEVVTRMETENRGFIEFLKEKSGIPNFEFRQLWMVFDNLFCMLQHNDTHKWPSWVNASVFDRIYKLYDASSRLKYHTDLLRRLRGGPLLKEIIERFEAKVNERLGDKPKLYAYSAHDTTLAAMLSAMGIYPEHFPRYSSAVLLELHRKDGQLVMEVYYKNVTDGDNLYYFDIPGCEHPCTLDAFKSAMLRYLPVDWTAECGLDGPNVKNYMISTAVLALSTALLAGILIMDVVLKRNRHYTIVESPLLASDGEA